MEASEAARTLGARRPRMVVPCDMCGKEVEGTRRRRFCSDTCRVSFARHRRRAATARSFTTTLAGLPVSPDRSPSQEPEPATQPSTGHLVDRQLHRANLNATELRLVSRAILHATREAITLVTGVRKPPL